MTKELFEKIKDAEVVANEAKSKIAALMSLSTEPKLTEYLLVEVVRLSVATDEAWRKIEHREDYQYENRQEALKTFRAVKSVNRIEEANQ